MNLIELSNNLKDVPDQLLLKEVQEPTGAYPAYLVITEMTRRKRMRDSVMKEAPQTTVAEDLAQPSREQMMRAMAQMHQAQPMSQPPQSLNAGLMAAAQPEELAAMDANAAPQQSMAGGGLVAFSKGGETDDGVAHYFGGGATDADDIYAPIRPMSYGEQMSNVFGAIANAPMQLIRRIVSDPSLDEDQKKAAIAKVKDQTDAETARLTRQNAAPVSTFTAPTSGRSKSDKGDKGTGGRSKERLNMPPAQAALAPEQVQLNELTKGILAFKDLNPEQQAAAQARGEAAYQEKNPFRLGFLEESMKERQGDIDKMKDTAFNNMLMQTGAGIMKSKSPYFLSALGEGSEAGLAAYQQGVKDMRASKDALLQSRVAFANAQTLYDQGKTSAGERERDRADKLNSRGLELANSKFAAYKAIQDNRREEEKLEMERRMEPYKQKYMAGLTNQANAMAATAGTRGAAGNKVSDADQNEAAKYAYSFAIMQKLKPGTPEFESVRNQKYQEIILQRAAGTNFQAGTYPPLGGSGAEFVGFRQP
jgi:hypothetical protein